MREIRSSSNDKIQVLAKPNRCLRSSVFSKLKTKIDPQQRTNVIYSFPCQGNENGPCDKSYVGQTRNRLDTRLAQHNNSIENGRNPNGQSAVVSHYQTYGHQPDLEKARVLATESHWRRRNTRESLHILTENTYNLRRDTRGIAANYCAILKSRRRNNNITVNDT